MTAEAIPPNPLAQASVAVHAGRPDPMPDAPMNPPVVLTSTYVGVDPAGTGEIAYGRYGNPTWAALETAVGQLEGGAGIAYASGMAAANAAFQLLQPGGILVLPGNCYLGVSGIADERAARDGIEVRRVDVTNTSEVLAAARGADLVWLESPTNPMLDVADLPRICAELRSLPVITLVDNTFATPLLQRPLDFGADIVLHSATKFLGGHSDTLLGMLLTRDQELFTRLDSIRRTQGAIPGALDAYLVLRGIRTLHLRLAAAQANAQILAERLAAKAEAGSVLRKVRYPGLPTDPGHQVATRTMAGFGALIAVELADEAAARAFVSALRLWVPATSLGGVESTLERRRRWAGELSTVPRGLVRMSVGVEDVEDLWADLKQGLAVS